MLSAAAEDSPWLRARPHIWRKRRDRSGAHGHAPDRIAHRHAVHLRPTTTHNAARLTEILPHPAVAPGGGGRFDLDRVQRQLVALDDGTATFAVEAHVQVIGLIQYREENEQDDRHAAIDIFLHSDWRGRGLGADTIRTLARYLFEQRGHRGDSAGIATRSSGPMGNLAAACKVTLERKSASQLTSLAGTRPHMCALDGNLTAGL